MKKKEYQPLNIRLDKQINDQLEQFCARYGQTKTTAVERALALYLANPAGAFVPLPVENKDAEE